MNRLITILVAATLIPFSMIPASAETDYSDAFEDVPIASGAVSEQGDVDSDGKLTSNDALMILRASVGIERFNSTQTRKADMNGDSVVDSTDALLVLRLSIGANSGKTTTDDKALRYANEVLRLVNAERAKKGVGALTLDTKLCSAAQIRANELTRKFSHERPDGTSYDTALKEVNADRYSTWGENIAAGQESPQDVFNSWMNSKGHRENMLDPDYKKMGLGYVYNANTDYRHFWSQIFTN